MSLSFTRWDRHFSGSFRNCQGSSSVKRNLKNARVLHWCDICQETREDFDKHVKGVTKKKYIYIIYLGRILRFVSFSGENHIKIAKEVSEDIEDDRVLLSCDLCSVQVGTEANLRLHNLLPMHKKKKEQEGQERETSASEPMEA